MKHKLALLLALCVITLARAGEPPTPDRFAGYESLVAETHAASLKEREARLRQTIAKDTVWPHGTWGDNLWTLAALRLNERTDQANARLLQRASLYIEGYRAGCELASPTPENQDGAPWTFFSITDYVRTLCLFHSTSSHFPGRLTPEAEAAMKEALWLWTSKGSRLGDYGSEDLFLLLGTENHDLNIRPVHHLVTSLLANDPAYRDRKLDDGHTTAEHAAAHAAFFREWPGSRATSGMWIEVGSDVYQKYSWPALFNLHELSPDPVIRHRFGLLLDLALIEEAQISVKGRRGGGRSRAYHAAGGFEPMKRLLYGEGGGSSHSRVIEASLYQAPAEAILLRKRAFPAEKPFVIRNRVLGRIDDRGGEGHRIAVDSVLVNYAYRTPHYLLGSTLQNPAVHYSGISRQNRTCGLLFDNPASPGISQIHPVAEHTGGGRSQHSYWGVQYENVLVVQRIARIGRGHPGSYNTGKLGIRFDGADLERTEEDGWIFATNGKAFAAVRFLDGGHVWDEAKTVANPASDTGPGNTTRILLHAGDVSSHESFEEFREAVRSHLLEVTTDKVDYRFGANRIEMTRYDAYAPQSFTLPLIHGRTVDLHPDAVYESPFLNGEFGSDRFTVTVGPINRTRDFEAMPDAAPR
jgi:hypothetical protein